ncbi:MAG: DUF481 domain-containing protein, partial [Verrucomicrobiota bacterium]
LSYLITALLCFGSTFLYGAEIILQDGDRLTGTVRGVEEGLLIVEHPYSDSDMKIPLTKIESLASDKKLRVKLTNGDIITGEVKEIRDEKMVFHTPYHGELTIPVNDVDDIAVTSEDADGNFPVDGEREAAVAAESAGDDEGNDLPDSGESKEETQAEEEMSPESHPRRDLWSGSLSAGGNRQTGNTERTSATFEVNAARETEVDELGLRFRYNYAEEDNSLTARNVYGEINYHYDITPRTYWLLEMSLLSDEFRDLDLRTTSGVGLGYRWLDRESLRFATEGGLTYITRNYEGHEDDNSLSARLAAIFEWDVSDTFSLTEELTFYPALEGGSDIVKNEAGIKSQITNAWFLKLLHVINHDTDPPDGIDKTDTKLVLSLGYDF